MMKLIDKTQRPVAHITAPLFTLPRQRLAENADFAGTRCIQTAEQMQRMQAEAQTGTTNLGALLKAKLDTKNQ